MKRYLFLFFLIILLPIKVLALTTIDYYSINLDSTNVNKEIKVREEFEFKEIDIIGSEFNKEIAKKSINFKTNIDYEMKNNKILFRPDINKRYYIEYSIDTSYIKTSFSKVKLVVVDYIFYPIKERNRDIKNYNSFVFHWKNDKAIDVDKYYFLKNFEVSNNIESIDATLLEGKSVPDIKVLFTFESHEKDIDSIMNFIDKLFHIISIIIVLLIILAYARIIKINIIICIIIIIIYSIVAYYQMQYIKANIVPLFDKDEEKYFFYCENLYFALLFVFASYIINRKVKNI